MLLLDTPVMVTWTPARQPNRFASGPTAPLRLFTFPKPKEQNMRYPSSVGSDGAPVARQGPRPCHVLEGMQEEAAGKLDTMFRAGTEKLKAAEKATAVAS